MSGVTLLEITFISKLLKVMAEINKKLVNKRYEIYTCSGKRIFVSGTDAITNFSTNDFTVYDENGNVAGQFRLDNIEGWMIEKGEQL